MLQASHLILHNCFIIPLTIQKVVNKNIFYSVKETKHKKIILMLFLYAKFKKENSLATKRLNSRAVHPS